MQIEIVTTKKKLTKNHISQMRIASETVLRCGRVLGYILNARKYVHSLALIKFEDDYYYISLDFEISNNSISVYRQPSRNFHQKISFKLEEERQHWIKSYQKVQAIALKTHIYI